jgi:hypothetical protein
MRRGTHSSKLAVFISAVKDPQRVLSLDANLGG